MMPIKTYKKIAKIVLYFVIKINLEISFQNGPEYETTQVLGICSNRRALVVYREITHLCEISKEGPRRNILLARPLKIYQRFEISNI